MRFWERKGQQKNKNNSPLPVRWTFWESSTTCEFLLLLFVDFFKKSFVVPYKITLSLCIPPSYTPLMKEMNVEASWRYAFVFSFMVGDSKVPRISTITTLKFSQSILIFKILSRKRAIYRELKKQRRRRCVYVSKASSSLFVDYINRKKRKNGWKDTGIDGRSDERVHRWSGFEGFPFLKARPIAERYREISSWSILEFPTSNHHQTPTTQGFLE